jgi:hydrogenase/urease accessory protein HupE
MEGVMDLAFYGLAFAAYVTALIEKDRVASAVRFVGAICLLILAKLWS